jgi:uncharacterized protein with NRDE domain
LCLIGIALDAHPHFALVVAANRDEFFDRPAAPLDWWRTADHAPWLLGGRDLAAGGTWFGLSASGRIGMLTNVRDPARHRADAASRGALVTDWLDRGAWPVAPHATNPFNLIGGDLHARRWWWTSDRHAAPAPLAGGVHALSNGTLDEPWPKVRHLSSQLRRTLDDVTHDDDELVERLFALLADDQPAPDHALPDTGVGLDRERRLSPAFIRWPEARYGTRCSTVVLGRVEGAGRWSVQVHERTHGDDGRAAAHRRVALDDWPHDIARAPVVERALS